MTEKKGILNHLADTELCLFMWNADNLDLYIAHFVLCGFMCNFASTQFKIVKKDSVYTVRCTYCVIFIKYIFFYRPNDLTSSLRDSVDDMDTKAGTWSYFIDFIMCVYKQKRA